MILASILSPQIISKVAGILKKTLSSISDVQLGAVARALISAYPSQMFSGFFGLVLLHPLPLFSV